MPRSSLNYGGDGHCPAGLLMTPVSREAGDGSNWLGKLKERQRLLALGKDGSRLLVRGQESHCTPQTSELGLEHYWVKGQVLSEEG